MSLGAPWGFLALPPRLKITKLDCPELAHSRASIGEDSHLGQRPVTPLILASSEGGWKDWPWAGYLGCRVTWTPSGPAGNREGARVLGDTVHCSASLKSRKCQLALKSIPDGSQAGSHAALMMQLGAPVPGPFSQPPREARGRRGQLQITEVFVHVVFC